MKKIILAISIFMTTITASLAGNIYTNSNIAEAGSYYNNTNYYTKGSCVYYAFNRRAQLNKPVSNQWGNAKNWAYNATRSGYTVKNVPKKYAVMISQKGYYGHASVVERINRNGSILVSEMNYPRQGVKTYRTIPKYEVRSHQFIY